MVSKRWKGFTLIELLITIAIIAIIVVVVFVALDPITRFQEARDARRVEDIDAIVQSIYLYQVDNGGQLPNGVDANWRMLGTNNAGCDIDCGGLNLEESCLDLTNVLSAYLPKIPKDPEVGSDEKTYYAVSVNDTQINAVNCYTGQVGSLPSYSEYPGSTDFTSVPDLTAVDNMTLANAHGSIEFPNGYTVNASGEDYDSNVQIGEGFISVNPANLDASFNSAVTLSFNNINCPTDIYYAADVYGSSAEVVNNGAVCNGGTVPSCTNITCNAGTIRFSAEHFSSYAVPLDPVEENNIDLEEGLVAYWNMNENIGASIADSSGNNNAGIIDGAEWTDGREGSGLDFDGSGGHVLVDNSDSLNITEDEITLSVWFKKSDLSDGGAFIFKNSQYFLWIDSNGKVNFILYKPNWTEVSLEWVDRINDTDWHHVVALYDGEAMKIYIDNQELASLETNGNIQSRTNDVRIGSQNDTLNEFDGLLDTIRIYDRAVSLEEIDALYNEVGELVVNEDNEAQAPQLLVALEENQVNRSFPVFPEIDRLSNIITNMTYGIGTNLNENYNGTNDIDQVMIRGEINGNISLFQGQDRLYIERDVNGIIDMGDGADMCEIDRYVNRDIILGDGDDKLDVERDVNGSIVAGLGNDTLYLNRSVNRSIDLGEGHDILKIGRDFNNTLIAGTGNDYIQVAREVNNVMNLGDGDDFFEALHHVYASIQAGEGNDTLFLSKQLTQPVTLGTGNDFLRIGSNVYNTIDGGEGVDSIELLDYTKLNYDNNNKDNIRNRVLNFENIKFSDGEVIGNAEVFDGNIVEASYTLQFRATLNDLDGSESLSNITLSNLPASVVAVKNDQGVEVAGDGNGNYVFVVNSGELLEITLESTDILDGSEGFVTSISSIENNGGATASTIINGIGIHLGNQ
ncbi:prepilin-type N-terminal cleavage/methylation domain-containing protein [Patescibacteria group bacterium]|nr:prepilin-type N-terminal cleavage/methylation domain-containing protein [Patescibacteria group bacterium]MBU1721938.1 prepilin-type N-terminal cleavage/methylation domain-containing protein [Patescibacteria group bacterium]MBU1901790.1 prepilin-type N-terminal cleavage/methylation domain-containing protein [Patescibacteria group bacterium]